MSFIPAGLPKECSKAVKILQSFVNPNHKGLDGVIPRQVLEKAQGFAFLSVAKAGFLVSARAGSGLVIAKLDDGTWSAPSAIGTAGMGLGTQAGAEVTEFLFVLNSKSAVRSFMSSGAITLGGSLSVALGPLGRTGEAGGSVNTSGKVAAMYTYSKSRGLFGGASLEGSIIGERQEANSMAYESNVTSQMLLSGVVPVPPWADPLIRMINSVTGGKGGRRWVRETPTRHLEDYVFTGTGSPGSINPGEGKKSRKSTSKGEEFPPKDWGQPKKGGSYFDSWDNQPNDMGDGDRDLIDVSTPPIGPTRSGNPFAHMSSPFDTSNAAIHIAPERMTSPFDTSSLKRSGSGGGDGSSSRPKPTRADSYERSKALWMDNDGSRPKSGRTESAGSIGAMKDRATKLIESDRSLSAFSKLALKASPNPPTSGYKSPTQGNLIDYSPEDYPSQQDHTHRQSPTPLPLDLNLPYHLQEVHVDLDKTNVSIELQGPRSSGEKGGTRHTVLRKNSLGNPYGVSNYSTPMDGTVNRKKLFDVESDSSDEEGARHKRAPSQRFKAALKEPLVEGVGKAIVRFDFEAVEPEDLTIRKGDIIVILEKSDSVNDWWKGKVDDRVGNFPANFVEVVETPQAQLHAKPQEPLDSFDSL